MTDIPACPRCAGENTYPDGDNFVCADCAFEWPMVAEAGAAGTQVRDCNGNVLADGDSVVVINIRQGDTLRTDELWWDQNAEEFHTDRNVRIFQKDKTIYGKGLRAAQDFSWYDIFHITGIVLSDGELE